MTLGYNDDELGMRVSSFHLPDTEELSGSCTQSNVAALVVMNACLAQHGVVFQLGLAQRRSVGGDEHKLGLAASHGLQCGLQSERLEELASETQWAPVVVAVLTTLPLLITSWSLLLMLSLVVFLVLGAICSGTSSVKE